MLFEKETCIVFDNGKKHKKTKQNEENKLTITFKLTLIKGNSDTQKNLIYINMKSPHN